MSAFLAGKPEQGIKLFALMTFLMLAMFLRCKTVGWDGHVGTSYYAVSGYRGFVPVLLVWLLGVEV
jgi:hypothetical protein